MTHGLGNSACDTAVDKIIISFHQGDDNKMHGDLTAANQFAKFRMDDEIEDSDEGDSGYR